MILEEAKELDKKYNLVISLNEKAGKKSIIVKDNISTKGIRTTAGSKILENYIPVFDATVIEKLKDEGYSVLGKTAMDEFGFGTFSNNTFKVPKNPHNAERCCGGSSGGSAAYVAASKFVDVALGTSTGGSISCPASFCGVVGLTPTYGLVSRYGLIDYASSLDKIGILAKTTKQAAEMLSMISGKDGKDQTCQSDSKDYVKFCKKSLKGIKIGVPREYVSKANLDVKAVFEKAIERLKELGAEISEISLPLTEYALAAYYIIATAEASTNLAKFCGLRYGETAELNKEFNEFFSDVREKNFGTEAKRRIILGTFVRMAGYRDQYYKKALSVRDEIIEEFKTAFEKYDVLVAPTMPCMAPKFSEIEKLSPAEHYAMDVLTVPPNLAGLPHISVPCGFVEKMPIGLHIFANHFCEEKIIEVASAYE